MDIKKQLKYIYHYNRGIPQQPAFGQCRWRRTPFLGDRRFVCFAKC